MLLSAHPRACREPDVPGAARISNVMLDFHVCSWGDSGLSAHDESLAAHFDALNEPTFSAVLRVRAGCNGGVDARGSAEGRLRPAAGGGEAGSEALLLDGTPPPSRSRCALPFVC